MPEYSIDNLKPDDRKCVETVSDFASSVLTDEKVDEYISNNICGKTTQALYGEVLKPFMNFLREQADYFKVDLIIDRCEKENAS